MITWENWFGDFQSGELLDGEVRYLIWRITPSEFRVGVYGADNVLHELAAVRTSDRLTPAQAREKMRQRAEEHLQAHVLPVLIRALESVTFEPPDEPPVELDELDVIEEVVELDESCVEEDEAVILPFTQEN